METKKLSDELLELIDGGVLPEGWEQTADAMAPALRKKNPNMTYEEACAELARHFDDPDDVAQLSEYIKKYF